MEKSFLFLLGICEDYFSRWILDGKIKKNQNNNFLSGRISSEVFQTDARKPPQEDLKDAESIRRILKPGALESFAVNIPCCALITLDPPLCFLETENMPEK